MALVLARCRPWMMLPGSLWGGGEGGGDEEQSIGQRGKKQVVMLLN